VKSRGDDYITHFYMGRSGIRFPGATTIRRWTEGRLLVTMFSLLETYVVFSFFFKFTGERFGVWCLVW
jgi:hypothetical protein